MPEKEAIGIVSEISACDEPLELMPEACAVDGVLAELGDENCFRAGNENGALEHLRGAELDVCLGGAVDEKLEGRTSDNKVDVVQADTAPCRDVDGSKIRLVVGILVDVLFCLLREEILQQPLVQNIGEHNRGRLAVRVKMTHYILRRQVLVLLVSTPECSLIEAEVFDLSEDRKSGRCELPGQVQCLPERLSLLCCNVGQRRSS